MGRIAIALNTLGFAIWTTAGAVSAQTPAFEVASVRLSTGPATPGTQRITDARVDITGVPLRRVLLLAFRSADHQLAGPKWVDDVRVNIHATIPAGATRQQVPEMLQQLLAERFGLLTHRERRPLDTFALVVGAAGAKMREVQPVDDLDKSFTSAALDELNDTPDGPVRTVFAQLALTTLTGRTMYQLKPTDRGTQILDATRMTMAELATVLEINVDKPVIDKTGLTGIYEFRIELPPHARILRAIPALRSSASAVPTGVSTSGALDDIGLRLEGQRGPVDVLVVDKIERTPRDN